MSSQLPQPSAYHSRKKTDQKTGGEEKKSMNWPSHELSCDSDWLCDVNFFEPRFFLP